jgi:dihydropteroate synthase
MVRGVSILRVHDVRENRELVTMLRAIMSEREE